MHVNMNMKHNALQQMLSQQITWLSTESKYTAFVNS